MTHVGGRLWAAEPPSETLPRIFQLPHEARVAQPVHVGKAAMQRTKAAMAINYLGNQSATTPARLYKDMVFPFRVAREKANFSAN